MNKDAVADMLYELQVIELQIRLMKHLQKTHTNSWTLMLAVNAKIKQLKMCWNEIHCMLEQEYETIDLTDIMLILYES